MKGLPGLGPGGGARTELPKLGGAGLDEIAKALGISTAELQQDLKSGKSVKDIAASKGMDEAAFRSKLAGVVKADLDKQVAAGKLTQKQEDAILQRLQNGPLPLWDAPARQAPGHPKTRPSPSPSPGTTTG